MRKLGIYDQLASETMRQAHAAEDSKQDGEAELSMCSRRAVRLSFSRTCSHNPEPAFSLRKSNWSHEGYEFGTVMIPSE